jgi:hypothetical protein
MEAGLKIVSSSRCAAAASTAPAHYRRAILSTLKREAGPTVVRVLRGFAPVRFGGDAARKSGRPQMCGRPGRLLRNSNSTRLGLVDDPVS